MSIKPLLRAVKWRVARWVAAAWIIVLAAGRPYRRARIREWTSSGGTSVLIVAPHPDDEVVGCAGAILRHVAADDSVCVAIATDGRQSRALADPDAMAARRRAEARLAADLLGVQRFEWLGLPEGAWQEGALSAELCRLLRECRPDWMYVPSRIDFHPEHWRVARACATALGEGPQPLLGIRVYEVQVPFSTQLSNLLCDLSALEQPCAALTAAYASQAPSLRWLDRRRRYTALVYGRRGLAEAFWEMSPSQYIALHDGAPEQWPEAFRGLRGFPLTDPLAYWVGAAERKRLAARFGPAATS